MWNVMICDGDRKEREQLMEYVQNCCGKSNWDVLVEGCANWTELFEKLRQGEPDVVIVAQNGVDGLDTITSAHLPPWKFIWFSDLDFGVQAYRLCLSWFGKKPVTYSKMERALSRYMENVL